MGVVAVILLGAGGAFALWNYKQNKPDKVWVPMRINPKLTTEQKEQAAEQIKAKLLEGDIMLKVAEDTALASELKLDSREAAATLLKERLFVEAGEANTPTGIVPAINIGMNGKKKEMKALGKASTRLMEDVWKIMGIKPPSAPQSF